MVGERGRHDRGVVHALDRDREVAGRLLRIQAARCRSRHRKGAPYANDLGDRLPRPERLHCGQARVERVAVRAVGPEDQRPVGSLVGPDVLDCELGTRNRRSRSRARCRSPAPSASVDDAREVIARRRRPVVQTAWRSSLAETWCRRRTRTTRLARRRSSAACSVSPVLWIVERTSPLPRATTLTSSAVIPP